MAMPERSALALASHNHQQIKRCLPVVNSIVTFNLKNYSTPKFPAGVKNRRLSLILQEAKERFASNWRKRKEKIQQAELNFRDRFVRFIVEMKPLQIPAINLNSE